MDNWQKLWGNKRFWIAVLLAAAFVGYLLQPIRMFEDPYKVGEVTLFSMLILSLIGYFYGPVPAFLSCFVFGAAAFVFDVALGFSPLRFSEGLDYLLGYTLMGFGGFLGAHAGKKRRSLLASFSLAILLRFAESVFIWSFYRDVPVSFTSDLWYGFTNCLGYIGVEYVFSVLLLLIPQVKEAVAFLEKAATTPYVEQYDFF